MSKIDQSNDPSTANSSICTESHDHSHAGDHDHDHVHNHGGDHIPTDKLGMLLSGLCLVHCLLGPLIIVFLPTLAGSIGHELFHWIMLLGIIPIALFSFIKSYRSHGIKFPLQLGSFGIVVLLLGILIPELMGHEEELSRMGSLSLGNLETAFTVLGGICLAYAHYYNFRQCQCRD